MECIIVEEVPSINDEDLTVEESAENSEIFFNIKIPVRTTIAIPSNLITQDMEKEISRKKKGSTTG